MQDSGEPANLSKYSFEAPPAGVCRAFGGRSLFESSKSRFCPLAHGFCFKFRGFSFHDKDKLYSHQCEGWHPEKQIPAHRKMYAHIYWTEWRQAAAQNIRFYMPQFKLTSLGIN